MLSKGKRRLYALTTRADRYYLGQRAELREEEKALLEEHQRRVAEMKHEAAKKANAEVRRADIAKICGVPASWVMLEDEIANWRASTATVKDDGGFIATVKANAARALQSLVSHFRHSAIPGR